MFSKAISFRVVGIVWLRVNHFQTSLGFYVSAVQFLLFSQCFLLEQIIVSLLVLIFTIISLFAAKLEEPKIGISGKGLILPAFNLLSANALNLIQSRKLSFGKGLNDLYTEDG